MTNYSMIYGKHYLPKQLMLPWVIKMNKNINNSITRTTCANLILKGFYTKDHDILIALYKTYVRPLLEYNSSVWSPHCVTLVTVIERVPKFCIKRPNDLQHLSYAERLTVLNLFLLSCCRIHTDQILMYKIMHNLVDSALQTLVILHSSVSSSIMSTTANSLKLNQLIPRTNMLK